MPHRNRGAIDLTVLTHGVSQPEAQGLYGGFPSSVQVRLLLRDAEVRTLFEQRIVPTSFEEATGGDVEVLAAKQRTLFHPGDAILSVCAGGGGYGDPIERDPAAVSRDVEAGLVSVGAAREIYGVVLGGAESRHSVDEAATTARRKEIRAQRLADARPVGANGECYDGALADDLVPTGSVGASLKIAAAANGRVFACQACNRVLAPIDREPKTGTVWREAPIERLSAWNRFGMTDVIRIREFCCPSCAHLISVQVAKSGDPILLDTRLAPDERAPAAE
jgi:N-methylhydantoinase B